MASNDTASLPSAPPSPIETSRLTLRPFSTMLKPSLDTHSSKTLDDHYLAFFSRMRRQPRVMQWSLEGRTDSSLAQTEAWVVGQTDRTWSFVIERKSDQPADPHLHPHPHSQSHPPPSDEAGAGPAAEPIGSIAIRLPAENEKATDIQVESPELGFMLDETFHGQGYTTEAAAALLERFWAETEGCDVVEAYVRPANKGSRRVVTKCGFDYWKQDREDHVYRVTRPAKQTTGR